MLIIGNIFSLIGATFLIFSIFSKNKKHMITLQSMTTFFCCISNIFLNGYSAAIANTLITIRHILEIKGKINKVITVIICLLIITMGLYSNNRAWIGILPISASVLYIILAYYIKSVQNMRIAIIVSQIQWAFFDITIKSYPLFVVDIIIIVLTTIKYFKSRSSQQTQHRVKTKE